MNSGAEIFESGPPTSGSHGLSEDFAMEGFGIATLQPIPTELDCLELEVDVRRNGGGLPLSQPSGVVAVGQQSREKSPGSRALISEVAGISIHIATGFRGT